MMSTESAREASGASNCLPIVDYLKLGEDPHLVANQCVDCGARYFDRRNACAKCGKAEFVQTRVANDAVLKAFSVVHRAAPGVPVPYVSAIVETGDGTSVRANVLGLTDPMAAKLGMDLRFSVYNCGSDDNGTECVAFGYAVV